MKKSPARAGLFFAVGQMLSAAGAGVRVEPLGEGLISVFPDGFRPLFAPAAALPALLDMPVVPGWCPLRCPTSCRSR